MIEINDKIDIWKEAINSFVVVDYDTIDGVKTAKGKLTSVSEDGDIIVRHTQNDDIFWSFNIKLVISSKFTPMRGDDSGN